MWQPNTGFEDQYRQLTLNSLNGLFEKIERESVDDSMLILSAVGLVEEQDAGFYRKLADYCYANFDWIGSVVNFNKCCTLDPNDFNSMFYLACSYKNLGLFHQAIDVFKKSLAIHEYPEAMVNLASTYSSANENQLELETLELLTSKFKGFTLGHYNLGILWYGKRSLQKSIQSYWRALETNPYHGESKVALSVALLMNKQYVEGFAMHDSRWGVSPNCPIREFNRPYWYGQDIPPGSSIFVTLEQGFGDTLQMLRYLPMLSNLFGEIAIEVQPQMKRLVAMAYPFVNVVVYGSQFPQTDYYCPVMSLPRAFNTSYDNVPGQYAYIDISSFEPLKKSFLCDQRTKIGVCWRGGMLDPRMAHRSLSIKSIKNLFEHDNYIWVSLVKDLPDDERAELTTTKLIDVTSELTDFYDTYRLITGLDIVITVDTAVAHLAGAMGKPTIVILNEGYDWRWHVNDDISAWYPLTRLLRAYKLESPRTVVPELLSQVKKILG